MENRNIIIALIAIIAVLALVLGVMFMQSANAKEPTKVRVTSNNTLTEGDAILIQLTDLNKTPLSKQKVNITVKNSKGKVVVNKTVVTNSKGLAKLDSNLKKGKYAVNVTYGGNENYTGNNTSQILTVKEETVQATVSQSTNDDSSSQSSVREEYQITPDGWNPREHEVSRRSVEGGNELVSYDDHYFRIVDQNGNVITHGYR